MCVMLILYLGPAGGRGVWIHCSGLHVSRASRDCGSGGSRAAATVPARVCALWRLAELCLTWRQSWNDPNVGSNHTFNTYQSCDTEKSPKSFEVVFSPVTQGLYVDPALFRCQHGVYKIFLLNIMPRPVLPEGLSHRLLTLNWSMQWVAVTSVYFLTIFPDFTHSRWK